MTPAVPEIRSVPVSAITILNPRVRNRRIFDELVASIANLGLKKPITVSPREDGGYDLICGQGRLEAYIALGQAEIPAVIAEATPEDCFVMSLVENLARRQHRPLDLVREIGALKTRGYSTQEIAAKTDSSAEWVWAICFLLDNGEERLINAVERGSSRLRSRSRSPRPETGKCRPPWRTPMSKRPCRATRCWRSAGSSNSVAPAARQGSAARAGRGPIGR